MNNDDDIETIDGGDVRQHVLAEGASEFNKDPSEFMNFLSGSQRATRSFMQEINEQHITDGPIMDAATPDRSGNPDAMADLLRRFNGEAEYTIDNSLRDPEFGPDLQRALITESSKNDMWKIQLTESASAGKYNIVNSLSRKSFFEGITLMGAAKKICDCLENNHAVNSPKIQQVLYHDRIYENHYNECQNFKRLHQKYKKADNIAKMNVMADKYDHSKEKALSAKHAIKTL